MKITANFLSALISTALCFWTICWHPAGWGVRSAQPLASEQEKQHFWGKKKMDFAVQEGKVV